MCSLSVPLARSLRRTPGFRFMANVVKLSAFCALGIVCSFLVPPPHSRRHGRNLRCRFMAKGVNLSAFCALGRGCSLPVLLAQSLTQTARCSESALYKTIWGMSTITDALACEGNMLNGTKSVGRHPAEGCRAQVILPEKEKSTEIHCVEAYPFHTVWSDSDRFLYNFAQCGMIFHQNTLCGGVPQTEFLSSFPSLDPARNPLHKGSRRQHV